MLPVQLVEAFLLGSVHGRLLENAPGLAARKGLHRMNGVFCRVAASFNNHMHSDSKKRRSFLALLFAPGDLRR